MVKAKVIGNLFEKLFYRSVTAQGMACLRIEDGCKRVPGGRGAPKLIPVRQACDYVVIYKGRPAFLDTKTLGTAKTFPYANINNIQVHSMSYMVAHGAVGGYIVWFREMDKVVFYSTDVLKLALANKEGLHWEDGKYLGLIDDIQLGIIYE